MQDDVKFLVVVPTIRQDRSRFQETMWRLQETFKLPTEFHILDGSEGKPTALNRALAELLPASPAEFYVTVDDDVILGRDWQAKIMQGFADLPKAGMLSTWVGDDQEFQKLIGSERVDKPIQVGKTVFRKVQRGHHIAGFLHCYRRSAIEALGPQPITGEKYQVWEDAWRGRRLQSLGFEIGFVECDEPPKLIEYEDDPAEYAAWKTEQVAQSRKNQDEWLKDSGIPDPWTLQLRRWAAKIRGKGQP